MCIYRLQGCRVAPNNGITKNTQISDFCPCGCGLGSEVFDDISQGVVNVLIKHHSNIEDKTSNGYFFK